MSRFTICSHLQKAINRTLVWKTPKISQLDVIGPFLPRSTYSKYSVRFCTLIAQLTHTRTTDHFLPSRVVTPTATCSPLSEPIFEMRGHGSSIGCLRLWRHPCLERISFPKWKYLFQMVILKKLHSLTLPLVFTSPTFVAWDWIALLRSRYQIGSRAKEMAFNAITNQVNAWLFSWMRSSCETHEEYKISKALFAIYLSSPNVLQHANKCAAERIQAFIQEHVETLESFICLYLQHHVCPFDTSTNLGHEGINNGLETAAPVLPQLPSLIRIHR